MDEMLRNGPAQDALFSEFVANLGETMNLKTHSGFRGSLNAKDCESFPYHASLKREIVFHVFPNLTSSSQR